MGFEGRQTVEIGAYRARVESALGEMKEQGFGRRIWEKDASLWKQGPEGEKVILNRLGWLNIARTMLGRVDEINSFAQEVKNEGFTHAILMGMGGSSLSPEVSRLTFTVKPGWLDLMVLDSTVPASVLMAEQAVNLESTLFIISSKSGTTIETVSAYRYFYDKLRALKGDEAGKSFISITDPGSWLEQETREKGLRRVFTNFADIGGRYSALSYFGLVPAALIGADIKLLLERAVGMMEECGPQTALADNPALVLGAAMAELAKEGRDKLTLILPPEIADFGCWVEQLVAESTGKNGKGILPVEGEPVDTPGRFGDDRLFVYTRLKSARNPELDAQVRTLEEAGHPVVEIELEDIYDLGREYFRWEMATAAASALLGVNSFDEPNVAESKTNTKRLIGQFESTGSLPSPKPLVEEDGVVVFGHDAKGASLSSCLAAHLDQSRPGDYFALMAFLDRTPEVEDALADIRARLMEKYSAAVTIGYGPRFLHSTGQFHKGGPNTGIFIQFTSGDPCDVPIPGEKYGFSVLKDAQAMGDAIALEEKGRRFLRIHLGCDAARGLRTVLRAMRI